MLRVRLTGCLALSTLLLAGCSSSDSPTATSGTVTKAATPSGDSNKYGGLGATIAAFEAQNNTMRGAELAAGVAYYSVDATSSNGRVSEYSVQIKTSPGMDNGTRMSLVMGINLPADQRTVRSTPHCIDVSSAMLARLIGKRFAHVTTETGSDSAQVASASAPSC